jgi:hypothetical protein
MHLKMYCADVKIPLEGLTAACCSIASGRLVVWLSRNPLPHVATSQCPGLQPAIDPDSAGVLVLYGLALQAKWGSE